MSTVSAASNAQGVESGGLRDHRPGSGIRGDLLCRLQGSDVVTVPGGPGHVGQLGSRDWTASPSPDWSSRPSQSQPRPFGRLILVGLSFMTPAGGARLGAAAAELGDEVAVASDGGVVDAAAAVAGADPALGDEDVAEPGGGDEDDVGARRYRDRSPAVAGAGEGGVGQREDHPAVADAVADDHVVSDGHGRAGPAVAVVEQRDAERPRGGVGRHHRLDGTGLSDRV